MRKKHFVAVIVISVIIIGGGIVFMINNTTVQEEQRLFESVRNHVDTYGDSTITLRELTNFDWEKALFFRHHTPLDDIEEMIGVRYTGET